MILAVILASIILIALAFVWNTYTNKNPEENEYIAEKTISENNEEENTSEEQEQTPEEQSAETTPEPEQTESPAPLPAPTPAPAPEPKAEQTISSFSTKIYSKDTARQNNINITCNTLNGTTVKNGATFSFCNTVGQASSKKGYQKADIFDKNGNKKKGLGGGNCQISTTLYNAVLKTSGLQVTERHAHSNKVPYIQTGKDAAVAYGSYDFKFVNQTGSDIKIKASSDGNNVSTSIIKL